MKTYVLTAELERDEDGRWSAWIDVLPGCTAWGHTREEALLALQDAADAYIEDMEDAGLKTSLFRRSHESRALARS